MSTFANVMRYLFCPKCGERYSKKTLTSFRKTKEVLCCDHCTFSFYNNPKPTVGVILENKKGHILLVRRAVAPFKAWWDLPGGFMKYGETPHQTLCREVKEELGLVLPPVQLVGLFHAFYSNGNRCKEDERYSLTVLVYVAILAKDLDLKPQDDIDACRFFDPSRTLPRIAFKEQRAFLYKWLKQRS